MCYVIVKQRGGVHFQEQECIPVGCVPADRLTVFWSWGVPDSGGCTWSQGGTWSGGVPDSGGGGVPGHGGGGVPGLGGHLVGGVYLVWGSAWSGTPPPPVNRMNDRQV